MANHAANRRIGLRGKGAARQSRNQRSADSLARMFPPRLLLRADKAVRAPGESSPDATKLGDSTAKTPGERGWPRLIRFRSAFNALVDVASVTVNLPEIAEIP